MTSEQIDKLHQKIISGQSLKMLCWEFKMKEKDIIKFAKDKGLILRKGDHISYANKIDKKKFIETVKPRDLTVF